MALTRRYNLQIFLPPASARPLSFPLYSPFLSRPFLLLAHLGRYINVNPRAFLRSPFLDARTNSQSRLWPLSPFFHPSSHLSSRLCSSLLLSWPVNLPFFAICEGSGVHSRYESSAACRKARPLFDVSVIYSCPIYLAITARCGLDRAIVSELFCSLCFSSLQISHESHTNLTQSNLT